MRLFIFLLLPSLLIGCGESAPTPTPASPSQEYSDLAWSLKTQLESSTKCREIGTAVAKWDAEHGKRFVELIATVPKLTGGHASNYQSMEWAFKSVAGRCIHPKQRLPPIIEHSAAVEKVYKMLPKMKQGFEMR